MRRPPLLVVPVRLIALVACVFFSTTVALVAKEFDTSTLKKGDKVEVNVFDNWQPGTVIEVIDNGWVWVRTAEVGKHLYTPDNIRLAAAADGPNPFATEEEKGDKTILRMWRDVTGKHEVEAQLVRHEEDQVVLKRKDGKEITLPFARLSSADQQFLTGSSDVVPATDTRDSKTIELTQTQLDRARPADVALVGPWQYVADTTSGSTSSFANVRVPLGNKVDFFENPTGLLLAPAKKEAFAILLNTHPGADDYVTRVIDCDLAAKSIKAVAQFVPGEEPIDLSEDGKLVLARSAGFGFGKQARLTIYSLEGKEVTPVVAWEPYGQAKDHDSDVRWARFVGPQQVLAVSEIGVLSLWKTDDLGALWTAQGSREALPGLSASNKTVSLAVEGGIVLLETQTGRKLGSLPAEKAGVRADLTALDATGSKLALVNAGRCRVWELGDQQLTREFPIPTNLKCDSLVWCGSEHLLVDGRCLIDVTRRVWAWEYENVAAAVRQQGSQTWYITGGSQPGQDAFVLCSATLPDQAARSATASLDADGLLVIKPGMKVSLEINLGSSSEDQQKATEGLTARLQKSGLIVEEGSPLKLTCTIRPGESQKIEYRDFRSFKSTSHNATSQILEIAYVSGSEKLWSYESKTSPPHMLSLNEGENVNQALKREMRQDPARIGSIWIPGYVAKGPLNAPYGKSPEPSGG